MINYLLIKKEQGFTPILVLGAIVVLLALFVFIFFFLRQDNRRLEDLGSADIAPGIVVDSNGIPCETQDTTYCHETPDIESWEDDELP